MNINVQGLSASALEAVQQQLQETSFRPPRGPAHEIDRPRLIARLKDGLAHRLTVVRGGPGYGKTTLLCQCWEAFEDVVDHRVWLALENGNNDPGWFAAQLVAACESAAIDLGALSAEVQSGGLSMPAPTLMVALAHKLSQVGGTVAVFLDGYDPTQSGGFDALIGTLLENSEAHVRLVVATRRKLGLASPWSDWKIAEVAQEELAFTPAEAASLLQELLASEDIRRLVDRTDGSPGLLQMAYAWLRSDPAAVQLIRSFSGGVDEVSSYLAERVLGSLPLDLQLFLLQTSILRLVSGDLANAVCDRTDGWQCLDQLCEMGAMVSPFGYKRRWYRYHPVLSSYLRGELPHRLEKDKIASLHARASTWWNDNREPRQAAYHAWLAGDEERVIDIVESAPAAEFWLIRSIASFDLLLEVLPQHVIDKSPRLLGLQALSQIKQGRLAEANGTLKKIPKSRPDAYYIGCLLKVYSDEAVTETYLAELEKLSESAELSAPLFRGVLNNALTLLHFRQGNFTRAIQATERAIESYKSAGSTFGLTFMSLHHGMYKMMSCQVGAASDDYRSAEALHRTTMPWDKGISALIEVFRAEVCFEQGDLETAGELVELALPVVGAGEAWTEILTIGYRVASALAFVRDGLPGAWEVLNEASEVAQRRGNMRLLRWVKARRVYLAAAADKASADSKLLETADLFADIEPGRNRPGFGWYDDLVARLALCRVELCRGQPDMALEYLAPFETEWARQNGGWLVPRSLMMQALAYQDMGDLDKATSCLEQLLVLSQREKLRTVLLEEGAAGERLINTAFSRIEQRHRSSSMIDWVAELMTVGSKYRSGDTHAPENRALSRRETQVLQELGRGATNKVIAHNLGVTDHAIDFHMRNLFRKLRVTDRRLAVAVAKKSGLLRAIAESADNQPGTPSAIPQELTLPEDRPGPIVH